MTHPSPTAPDELLKLCESVLAEQRRLAAYMNFETDVTPRLADSINLDRVSKIARALKERLEAEAQLATRLPTRAEIEAKFGEWAMTGESTVMKARWMHEWLLSGASTPAPTAALTEDHLVSVMGEFITLQTKQDGEHEPITAVYIDGYDAAAKRIMSLLREKGMVKHG